MLDKTITLDVTFLQKVTPVLREMGFADVKEFLKEQALLLLMAKISRYKAECDYFQSKYGMSFEDFARKVENAKEEDFAQEEDLLDWRFAREALVELDQRKREIESA
ncbi:hypothetical protein Desku_2870 [Desulfofundulus kuznetsovii DSM 6115]|uniref:Uncharacterized protein n=1 Tax=Desulfofundulus kuznetsovii (strain DSM 6115 / VKM B-1805 / 17) TaxID=760568 RepID=A0AAU8PE36_DESK7|nr:hypothetical protein Desku_2870 [Desulfofundulus kuznetsovii DSM 6115]